MSYKDAKTLATIMYCNKCKGICLEYDSDEIQYSTARYRFDGHGYQFIDDDVYDSSSEAECCAVCQTRLTSVQVDKKVTNELLKEEYNCIPVLPIPHQELYKNVTQIRKALAQLKLKED